VFDGASHDLEKGARKEENGKIEKAETGKVKFLNPC